MTGVDLLMISICFLLSIYQLLATFQITSSAQVPSNFKDRSLFYFGLPL